MKIDAVFSGGGVKGFAYVGVLEVWQEKNLQVERAAGTSAGAIVAGLVAAGYRYKEIDQIMQDLSLETLADPPRLSQILPITKWLVLYFQLGLYKGEKLEKWLQKILAEKNIFTFADLDSNALRVIVSDLTLGKLVVLPDDLESVYGIKASSFSVAAAIRMSAGFPYFFMPKKLRGFHNQKSIIVDGGLLSNFPLWLFAKEDKNPIRPIIGVKLTDSQQTVASRKIHNALDMFPSLFTTMKQAHDNRYVSKHQTGQIIFVPTSGISSMDFQLSVEKRKELKKIGRTAAEQFLKTWSG